MKLKLLFLPFIFICTGYLSAQNGITFQVEELERATEFLPEKDILEIYQELIRKDNDLKIEDIQKEKTFSYDILAWSETQGKLVNYGFNPFLYGMYQAYADHRPFVLSPDIVWLLIAQGFACHVNSHAEDLRHYFVDFEGKGSLVVVNDYIDPDDPKTPWEAIFPEFTKQISERIGEKLTDVLTNNFSTSTPVTKVASEITIMNTFKEYFEYIVVRIVCGIPEITLEGTPEDWKKLYDKTMKLEKYELGWWIDELKPILKEFIKTSKGNVNAGFWKNMFKTYDPKGCGAGTSIIVDGWIAKFFPYNNKGAKYSLETLKMDKYLPQGMLKTDFTFMVIGGEKTEKIPLELWAGFTGLTQDPETKALRPEIGWMIRKSSLGDNKLKLTGIHENMDYEHLELRIGNFPKELLKIKKIGSLELNFINEVNIPEEFYNTKVGTFTIRGKISEDQTRLLVEKFATSYLYINKISYNRAKEKSPRNLLEE